MRIDSEAFSPLFDDVQEEFDKLMSFLSETDWAEILKKQNYNK